MPSLQLTSSATRALGRSVPAWAWVGVVWTGVAMYSIALTMESLRDHNAYDSSFDTAVYDQLVWLIGNGHEPFSTVVSRPMLANHFQPTVFLLAPLGWLDLGVPGLFALQSIGLALTAPALFALARAAGASEPLAVLPALLWLVSPAVASVNLFEFHPEAFVPLFLVLSVLFALRERYWLLAAATLVAFGLKEDVSITYVMLGVVLVLCGRRLMGLILALASAVWFMGASLAIERLGDSYAVFGKRYAGSRGDSVADALLWSIEHPLQTITDVASQSLFLVVVLLATTGGLVFLAPVWMLLAVPTAAQNALSAYEPQHQVIYHYHLGALAGLFVAAAIGVPRLASLPRPRLHLVALGLTFAATVALVVGLRVHEESATAIPVQSEDVDRLLARIPSDAAVAASRRLLPHLAHRVELYTLPEPFVQLDWGSPLTPRELRERTKRVRFVAYLETDPLEPFVNDDPPRVSVRRLLERDGFVRIGRTRHVELYARRNAPP